MKMTVEFDMVGLQRLIPEIGEILDKHNKALLDIKESSNLPNLQIDEKEVYEAFSRWYFRELDVCMTFAKRCWDEGGKPKIIFTHPRSTGDPGDRHGQIIVEFCVNNLTLPKRDQHNWHLQNTSQWVYAGAIVVDMSNGTVSTHH